MLKNCRKALALYAQITVETVTKPNDISNIPILLGKNAALREYKKPYILRWKPPLNLNRT